MHRVKLHVEDDRLERRWTIAVAIISVAAISVCLWGIFRGILQ
jgi:hypothetical protein